jgi:hypothetical protein
MNASFGRFKGELITYKPDIVGDFQFYRGAFKIKTGGAGHVREK